ncbi:hypothetical protein N7492_002073 [Penicillium capsulatum]|uniref:Uncharacterized protein n=1 Tax=Penicillium capsulatum TaxID=69766 RepID=A0A9W9IIR8_9EURO|nr:hypothetical protein N7492_002073 [Penicillium capsulatum]KAJ6123313.1 hypothetical protein N7512_005778 [Penicillium capsulatum]
METLFGMRSMTGKYFRDTAIILALGVFKCLDQISRLKIPGAIWIKQRHKLITGIDEFCRPGIEYSTLIEVNKSESSLQDTGSLHPPAAWFLSCLDWRSLSHGTYDRLIRLPSLLSYIGRFWGDL